MGERLAGGGSTCRGLEPAATADAKVEIADANAAAPQPLRRVVELADWREIFEGPDPAAAFWDETSECLSQFADMFDIADKDAEEVGKDNWGSGTYRHPLLSRPGTVLQVEQVVMSSTAGVVWDASKGLCDFLEAKPELVCGQRVIELGCGTALPGLTAAVLGASAVVLTDMDEALGPPRRSVAHNCDSWDTASESHGGGSSPPVVTVEPLMWGEDALPASIVGSAHGDVDVVIAADVLGATADGMIDGPGPFGLFLATLRLFARLPQARGPPRIFLAYKRRLRYRELPFFEWLADDFRLQVWMVEGGTGHIEPEDDEPAGDLGSEAAALYRHLTGHYVVELVPHETALR